MTYDIYNRPGSSTSVDGAVTNYFYTFAPNTQLANISTTTGTTTTTQWRLTTLDGFGRAIKVQTGHDSVTVNTVDTVYGACRCSPLGKVIKVSMPYRPGEAEVWTTYTYDGSGRQATSTAPDGTVTRTDYAGNTVTTTENYDTNPPSRHPQQHKEEALGGCLRQPHDPQRTGPCDRQPIYWPRHKLRIQRRQPTHQCLPDPFRHRPNRTFTYSGSYMLSETTLQPAR